jgi:hypothetical protein
MATCSPEDINIICDIGAEAFGIGTPEYDLFINGTTGPPPVTGFMDIIQPDCPLTLNILYGLFVAGSDEEGGFVSDVLDSAFNEAVTSVSVASFLATFVVLVAILMLLYTVNMVSALVSIFIVIGYIILCLIFAYLFRPSFTGSITSAIDSIDITTPQYLALYKAYDKAMTQVRLQASEATCT